MGPMISTAIVCAQQQEAQAEYIRLNQFPEPEIELAWCDCLDRIQSPAHYNAPAYFRDPAVLGERCFAVLATMENRVAGIMTGAYHGDHAFCGLMSRPQICVDGTTEPAATEDALARGFLTEASTAKLLTIYSWFPLEGFKRYGFRERTLEGVVVLDLTRDPEVLFKQLNKKRRNCIRSAMRQGVEVLPAKRMQDVEAFYDIYSTWYAETPKQIEGGRMPFEVFEQRFRLRDNFQIFLARYAGKVIAGITLRSLPGGLIEYSDNSSLREFLALRPNDLLLWNAIQWGCREGFPRFSLGGAHRFLREFGGTLTPVYRYRLDRTLLRRHDLRENLMDWGRSKLRKMPRPLETAVRRIAGKA
jgi:hypothetical protein